MSSRKLRSGLVTASTFAHPGFSPSQVCRCRWHFICRGKHYRRISVSSEITTLCLSMYILGFALGPLVLAPLSEYYG